MSTTPPEHGDSPTSEEEWKAALNDRFRAPLFPRDILRARIRESIRTVESEDRTDRSGRRAVYRTRLAQVAAALLLFVAGAGAGSIFPLSEAAPPPVVEPFELAHSIQGSGSAWVADLARLTADHDALSLEEREMATEVAWSAFRAAAVELVRQGGAHTQPDILLELLHTPRPTDSGPEPFRVIRF